MSPRIANKARGELSRAAARVIESRFAKPIARVVLVAAGLVLLAFIGRAGATGAFAGSSPAQGTHADAAAEPALTSMSTAPGAPAPAVIAAQSPVATANVPILRGRASEDDPVVLNTATADELRRLPGIGQKRADAILALRSRLGRFRAVEDLMKVKGIGRAMLKRLRPLVRIDGSPAARPPDGGPGPLPTVR